MNHRRKFNLQEYRMKPASKWFLVKMLFYGICLLVLGWLLFRQMNQPQLKKVKDQKEIRGVTIEEEH